jgi:phenylalanyl-tRNA synthetase beta chain
VRKGAKFHDLNTDASFRFERGVDPNITRTAITHAIKLIQKLLKETSRELLEEYPKKIEDSYVIIRFSKIEQILGTKFTEKK